MRRVMRGMLAIRHVRKLPNMLGVSPEN
jgi:hypothetical protein